MKLIDLIKSTAGIRDKQYPIKKIGSLDVVYYRSNKQLYITAQAFPTNPNRHTPYRVNLVFSGINFAEEPGKDVVIPYYSKPNVIDCYIERPSFDSKVLARCNCEDYYFMWEYFNKRNSSLLGPHKNYVRKTTHYPPKNPDQAPGLCKHILGLIKLLDRNKFIQRNLTATDYLNTPPRKYFT
jgi:hypothetical protein